MTMSDQFNSLFSATHLKPLVRTFIYQYSKSSNEVMGIISFYYIYLINL